jgi:hypothetical protein
LQAAIRYSFRAKNYRYSGFSRGFCDHGQRVIQKRRIWWRQSGVGPPIAGDKTLKKADYRSTSFPRFRHGIARK